MFDVDDFSSFIYTVLFAKETGQARINFMSFFFSLLDLSLLYPCFVSFCLFYYTAIRSETVVDNKKVFFSLIFFLSGIVRMTLYIFGELPTILPRCKIVFPLLYPKRLIGLHSIGFNNL